VNLNEEAKDKPLLKTIMYFLLTYRLKCEVEEMSKLGYISGYHGGKYVDDSFGKYS
jgi:hypothetical protein